MKLGNSSRAMGVGAYFLKVFLWGWLGAASCSVLESESALLGCKLQSENVLRSVHKLQSLVFATSGGFAQFDKLRENVWMVAHMSLSERCNLLPFFGRVVWGTTRREPRCDEPDRMSARWTCVNYWLWLSLTCVGNWVFIFTDLQRMADLFDLTSCDMC